MCWSGKNDYEPCDPVIDIEKLLVDYAWKNLAEPTFSDRIQKNRKFKLEVNWGYLDISHHVTSFEPWTAGSMFPKTPRKDGKSVTKRDLCLFRTEFKNESNEAQNFTFRTERSTTSKCEVTILQGFRMGMNLDLKIALPPVNASRITGGLSGELHISKSTGQTFEEQLTWSVDSQVKVEGKSRAVAALMIREEELNMDMTVESIVTARRDHIPVYVRSKKSGHLIKRLGIPSKKFPDILSDSLGFQKIGDFSVKYETKGVVRLIYGAEQVIDLKTQPIETEPIPEVTSTSRDVPLTVRIVTSENLKDNACLMPLPIEQREDELTEMNTE